MDEFFCPTCTRVWGGSPRCSSCDTNGAPFDPGEHGRRLIGGNNAWQALFPQLRADPLWQEAQRIIGQEGSASAVACALTYIDLLKHGATQPEQ